jgi:abortive infection bacteriophage resistance protein
METKKPTTFDEQIQLLKRRGLIIDNEILCKQFLKSINYYRFTAYLLPFKNPDDTYGNGVNFENVYKMYHFDRKMRTLLFGVVKKLSCI